LNHETPPQCDALIGGSAHHHVIDHLAFEKPAARIMISRDINPKVMPIAEALQASFFS